MNQKIYDVIVVGAGVTGSFIARELSKYCLKTAVLEKSNDVGNATTSANSAIIHSGYDPLPGTNKAKFNVLGNKMFDQIADELDVSFRRIGSLTIANFESQIPLLHELAERSKQNGVEVKIISGEEVAKLEPNIPHSFGALLAPSAGIINPFNLCVHAMENAVDNGVELFLSHEVKDIKYENDLFVIKTNNGDFISKIVINAAGVYADKIANMINPVDWKITPRKGEYFVLDHKVKDFVNHVIFPLPSEKGKGVLVSKTTSDNYIVGPSSELNDDRDDVSTDKLTLDMIKQQANLIVDNIPYNTVIRTFAGLRATCTRHDFVIEKDSKYDHFINVGGIESPGLVSSPAIAKYVVEELVSSISLLINNKDYNPRVRRYPHLKELPLEKRNELIKQNPDFGEMVCNCEQITLGEIKDVLNRSVPPHSIKGVKRRVRAGFGRCQGGFCEPKVVLLLAKHYGISPLEVPLDDVDSKILLSKVKEIN